jgi:hypothetical protein
MPDDPRNLPSGAPRLFERIAVLEGIAVLALAAVAAIVIGLATDQTWLGVVGGVLLVLVIADAVILAWVRRTRR